MVAVDLTIDADLGAERYVRDLNRGLQDLRKEAGLQYQDRIIVGIIAPEAVVAAVNTHRQWLADETLALDIRFGALDAPLASRNLHIAGLDEPVEIMLLRAVQVSTDP